MRLSKINSIFKKEVLDTLRDRRTLFTMIIIPLLLYPGLMLLVNSLASKQQVKMEQKTVRIALINIAEESRLMQMFRSEPRIQFVQTRSAEEDVRSGEIDFVIQVPDNLSDLLKENR